MVQTPPSLKITPVNGTTSVFKEDYDLDGKSYRLDPIQRIEKIGGLSAMEKAAMEDVFGTYAKRVPIHKRVSKQEIELLVQRELENRGVDIEFEYGVYSNGLPTKVKSRKFKYSESNVYKSHMFMDIEGNSTFDLLVSFPKKKRFLGAIHTRFGIVVTFIYIDNCCCVFRGYISIDKTKADIGNKNGFHQQYDA